MDSGAWRIEDNHVRVSVLGYECICENVLHIARIEVAVGDAIVGSIDASVLDSLRNVFNTNHFRCLARNELGDCACSCIEVIYDFRTSEGSKFAGYAIEFVCLLRVGLVEGFRTDLELKSFHVFVYGVFTFI